MLRGLRRYFFIGLCVGMCVQAHAADDQAAFFKQHVEPILIGRCIECHGPDPKAAFDLRTKATAMKGGKAGASIVPGDPASSLLYHNVSTQQMPPKKPLAKEEIAAIEKWIKDGAYFPDTPLDPFASTTERRAGYDWWSLQPLKPVKRPTMQEPSGGDAAFAHVWSANPVDRFVLAKLREQGLTPSPPADARTLLRRVTYDLTGLPPSPEDAAAFAAACQAETGAPAMVGEKAYRALIDRLLASPRYGEQWGRHWLDVVRYGESNGYERNFKIDNIWPYRDYVIKAFNDDKPFAQLVMEQLAGDSVDAGNPEVEVGMTFLSCGPYDDVGNADPAQAAQIRADALDEIIRTTAESFLGLTVGCARCHDHKFDPISQRDYYQFYATFAGVYNDSRTVATEEQRRARDAKLKPFENKRGAASLARNTLNEQILARANAKPEYAAKWTRPPVDRNGTTETFAPVEARFVRLIAEGRDDDPNAMAGFRIDEFEAWTAGAAPRNVALAANGGKAKGASNAPRDFADAYRPDLTIDGKYGAKWIAAGPELTIEFAKPETIERIIFSSDRNGMLQKDSGEISFVGEYRIAVSRDGEHWADVANSHDRQPVNTAQKNKRLFDLEASEAEKKQLAAYNQQVAEADRDIAAVPQLPSLRVGRLEQPQAACTVFLGGDPQRKGDAVTPAGMQTLARTETPYALPADAPERERRLALARWIINKDNPLPPRVLANRLWQHHFGAGIVGTPNDFGFMGMKPTHPELLDWLARELVQPSFDPDAMHDNAYNPLQRIAQAWRMKRLHKIVLLSQAYRQSGAYREDSAKADGDSTLLWRFPPRRLSGEEIRDTTLALAGKLDLQMGGPGFRLYDYLQDNVATYKPLDKVGPETYRRAVYHQQVRAMRVDLISDFDAPDCAFSAPRRVNTTTPLQALTMMNHGFTIDMAEAIAERLGREEKENLLERGYEIAFNREPDPSEAMSGNALIARHGVRAFCRALLNMDELVYLN